MAKKQAAKTESQRKLRPKLITDPEEVELVCQWMLGRESRPGEVLELRHVRDQLWEVVESKPEQSN